MTDIKQEIVEIFGNKLRCRVSGICVRNQEILLIKHLNIGKSEYFWSPPGGGIKFGESAIEALKREFIEETGLTIEVGKLMFVNEYLEPPLHAIELFFEVKILEGDIKMGYDPEMKTENQIIKELKFLSIQEIKKQKKGTCHQLFNHLQNLDDLKNMKGFYPSIP